jgi:predicted AlkP superfamily pyrophosphatase or phosphodiesterase
MEGETLREAFTRGGSNPRMLELIEKNFKKGMVQREHPGYDEFTINNACDIIREFKPDLLMLHVANIDDYRHKNGIFNDRVVKGVEETDEWIGRVMAAAGDAGVAEETTLFLTSDHGQIVITRSLNVNVLLADYGLIRADEKGQLVSWDAYSLSNGLSALVYLRDREDHRLYEKTYALLRHLCQEGIYGIGRVFTEPEARALEHLGGDFSFVLETDGYTSFGDDWKRPIVKNLDIADYRYGKATHGYLPDRGPQPMFMAKGPGIRPGVTLEKRDIIDEAPTFAKVLGLSLPEADGVPINEILL